MVAEDAQGIGNMGKLWMDGGLFYGDHPHPACSPDGVVFGEPIRTSPLGPASRVDMAVMTSRFFNSRGPMHAGSKSFIDGLS